MDDDPMMRPFLARVLATAEGVARVMGLDDYWPARLSLFRV